MNAHEIYQANVGNTHEAALQAVWDEAFRQGMQSGVTTPVAPTESVVVETRETPPVWSQP